MATTRLLHAACTVAMLAAVPAFAQSSNTAGQTGSSAMPQTQSGQTSTQGANTYGTMSQNNSMSPSNQDMDTSGHSGTHRSAHSRQMMHSSRTDTSQNAAVDQLNDQSLRAARQGQAFNATGGGMQGGGSGTMNDTSGSMSGSSGSMNDMSGGSMSGSGSMSGNR
jgi:hypothetical protein